ncbi:MAG: heme-copper oxidase subunit III [Pyrinomonadaceae bacterium]
MEIGTVETLPEPENKRNALSGVTSGTSPGNGGRSSNGGDGDNGGGGPKPHIEEELHRPPDKARILTWFVLLVVLMTFGGLIAAYVVISTNGAAEWKPFELPTPIWISTALIIASSLAFHFGKTSLDRYEQPPAKRWLTVTTVLGAAFISSQMIAWLELVRRGLYVQGNPYVGFFYIFTAVHAVHVVGGMIGLGAIVLRIWKPTESRSFQERTKVLGRAVGFYWHFMGILWLVLFVLLGFWK